MIEELHTVPKEVQEKRARSFAAYSHMEGYPDRHWSQGDILYFAEAYEWMRQQRDNWREIAMEEIRKGKE